MAGEILDEMELSSDDSSSRSVKKHKKDKKDKKERKDKRKDKQRTSDALLDDSLTTVPPSPSPSEQRKKEKREKKELKAAQALTLPSSSTPSTPPSATNGHSAPTSSKKRKTADADSASTSTKRVKASSEDGEATVAAVSPLDAPDAAGHPPLSSFPIHPSTLSILHKKGITHAFPIQSSTFHSVLACKDLVGRARTGTGKTLAFALPVCERLQAADEAAGVRLKVGRGPRVLVLTPTRELAKQVSETFELVGPRLSHTTVYGGSAYGPMEGALRRGVDVVVGTCGRVMDLLERKALKLGEVSVIILDEADEMLNMGFADDVEKILQSVDRSPSHPPVQTLLFSATIPSWVQTVAKKYLRKEAERVDLVGDVEQKGSRDVLHYAIACHWSERNALLKEVIAAYGGEKARTIVFTETKKEANEIALSSSVASMAGVLHGDIAQSQRETTLKGFREGRFSVLIATDVAARGIDISGVELVIQCEPPQSVETYIHRSGRTGRAGSKGVAVTFYTAKQVYWVNQIERLAKVKMTRAGVPQRDDIYATSAAAAVKAVTAVHRDVIPHFLSAARTLLSSSAFAPTKASSDESSESDESDTSPDPAYVLAAALAHASGHSQPLVARSLLMSTAGQTTVQYTSAVEVRSLSFVWSAIRRWLYPSEDESNARVKGMRLTADRRGAVFDVPSEDEPRVLDARKRMEAETRERARFDVCKALPALPEMAAVRPETRRWGGRSSGGGGGGWGGRSSGGGGRGGFRGRSSR